MCVDLNCFTKCAVAFYLIISVRLTTVVIVILVSGFWYFNIYADVKGLY